MNIAIHTKPDILTTSLQMYNFNRFCRSQKKYLNQKKKRSRAVNNICVNRSNSSKKKEREKETIVRAVIKALSNIIIRSCFDLQYLYFIHFYSKNAC